MIRASYLLPGAHKLVIELMRELDRGDGAFMGPAEGAHQLGLSLSHFKEVRAELQRQGLLKRQEVPGSRLDFWYPCLPIACEPEPPAGAKNEERRRWVRDRADELDQHLKGRKSRPVEDGISDLSPQLRTEFPKAQDGKPVLPEHGEADISSLSDQLKAVNQGVTTAVVTDRMRSEDGKPVLKGPLADAMDDKTREIMRRHEAKRRAMVGEAS